MSDQKTPEKVEEKDGDSFSRFEKFARALFRVDKREVPPHQVKRRSKPEKETTTTS